MTPIRTLLAAIVLLAATRAAHAVDPELEAAEERAFKQAVAVVSPSVVRIQTVAGLDRIGKVLAGTGPTTGVVVSEDGYIVSSSFNFAAKPASILVELPDGRRLTATEIATDQLKMLTLLKIDAEGLVPAIAARPEDVKVGQWAIAVGRTYEGPLPNVSVGIVSALDRIWGKAIQTDAKISPVNYGGPLVAADGRVQGLLVPLSPQATGETAGVEWYDSGIGFAIPMTDVYDAAERLKSGEDLRAGLMGVSLRGQGVLAGTPIVDRVRVNSPAARAGVKDGDVILEVDGTPVERQAAVRHVLGRKYAGDEIALGLKRGEETVDVTFELVDELVPYEAGYLGLLPVRPPVPMEGAEVEPGVEVRHVFEDSPAAIAGIEKRDRIVGVGAVDVTDTASLIDLVGRHLPEEEVEIRWLRDGNEQSAKVTLATYPTTVPAELPTWPVPPADVEQATGRRTERMEAQDHEFWAYVPESYNPEHPHGLVVWLHPGGDTMEAQIFKDWKTICERRNLILVGPKAAKLGGWDETEAEFVKDVIEKFEEDYSIDPQRVWLHGYADGGTFALTVAFKYREHVRGVAVVAGPLKSAPKEASPEERVQFYVTVGDKDPQFQPTIRSAQALEQAKFPTVQVTVPGRAHEYPSPENLGEIARWADALDRL